MAADVDVANQPWPQEARSDTLAAVRLGEPLERGTAQTEHPELNFAPARVRGLFRYGM